MTNADGGGGHNNVILSVPGAENVTSAQVSPAKHRRTDSVCTSPPAASVRVAALYVETNGVYYGLPDVDPWDEARDARLYDGPWPVVAHPPCQRWCRLAGMIATRYGYRRGDDGGCFAAALDAVRRFGGVIEHPAHSEAWPAFGLPEPMRGGGWTGSLTNEGWSAWVDQGWYGHTLKKPTWLYVAGVDEVPALRWGEGPGLELPHRDGSLSATQREYMTIPSPPAFRDVLLDLARSAASAGVCGLSR